MTHTVVHILYGLPGSGKTTWASLQEANVVDCDNMRGGCTPAKISAAIRRIYRDRQPIIVDGLCTTFAQLKAIVEAINTKNTVEYHLHFWKKDVDACLANDSKRSPERRSVLTIHRLAKEYKKPSKKQLESIGIQKMTEHEVAQNGYLHWWKEYDLYTPYRLNKNKRYLCSESWVTGGENWSYTGNKWAATIELQPISFREFDELLEKLVSTCTVLQYKKLERETVSLQSDNMRDYYHNHEVAYYQCDLEKLHYLLLEMGLIE